MSKVKLVLVIVISIILTISIIIIILSQIDAPRPPSILPSYPNATNIGSNLELSKVLNLLSCDMAFQVTAYQVFSTKDTINQVTQYYNDLRKKYNLIQKYYNGNDPNYKDNNICLEQDNGRPTIQIPTSKIIILSSSESSYFIKQDYATASNGTNIIIVMQGFYFSD